MCGSKTTLMQNNISVRQIEEKDKDWIKKFIVSAWGSEIIIASKPFNALTLPGFIAELNGKTVGIVTFNIVKGKLEIVSLNSTLEGKGIGSTLIAKMKELAKERKLKSVWLLTSNDNIDSLKFYQKRGFRITKVYPNAIDEARKIKPKIPEIGNYGIPLKDALELEYRIY